MSEAKEEPKFKVGDEVEHRFEHSTEWHRGKIIAINGNTTCTIEYENYVDKKHEDDKKGGLHEHGIEEGVYFDKNLRIALTNDMLKGVTDKIGVKVHIIEKHGDHIQGILHKAAANESENYILFQISTNKSNNNKDPVALAVHENVKINQVLRYDVNREDLVPNTSEVSILDEVHEGKIGVIGEVSEEGDIENLNQITCQVKFSDEKKNHPIPDIKISELLLYVKVPERPVNTDELIAFVEETLKDKQGENLKDIFNIKNLKDKNLKKQSQINSTINETLKSLYTSNSENNYILHALLNKLEEKDKGSTEPDDKEDKTIYEKNLNYLLSIDGEKQKDQKKSIILKPNTVVLKNKDGDTALLYALKLKIEMEKILPSLLAGTSAQETNKIQQTPLHVAFENASDPTVIKQIYETYTNAKYVGDGTGKKPIQYLKAGKLNGDLLKIDQHTNKDDLVKLITHLKAIGENLDIRKQNEATNRNNVEQNNILHIAVTKKCRHEVVKILVEKYNDEKNENWLTQRNIHGNLPLHTALRFSNTFETEENSDENKQNTDSGSETSRSIRGSNIFGSKNIFEIVKTFLEVKDPTVLKTQLETPNKQKNLPIHLVFMRCSCGINLCDCSTEKTKVTNYVIDKYIETFNTTKIISTMFNTTKIGTALKKLFKLENSIKLMPIHLAVLHQAPKNVIIKLLDFYDEEIVFPHYESNNEKLQSVYKFTKNDFVISVGSQERYFKKKQLGYIYKIDTDGDFYIDEFFSTGRYERLDHINCYFKPYKLQHGK